MSGINSNLIKLYELRCVITGKANNGNAFNLCYSRPSKTPATATEEYAYLTSYKWVFGPMDGEGTCYGMTGSCADKQISGLVYNNTWLYSILFSDGTSTPINAHDTANALKIVITSREL